MNKQHKSRLEEYRAIIEKELEQALYASEDLKVIEAMRYSALGGGKRIRGVLTLEFARIFGGNVQSAGCAAAAVEMIQTFSLIHDDLPCMDDDDFRRGKPSCHKQFDEAAALLAGDALLAGSFNTIAATAFLPNGIKPKSSLKLVSTLSNAALEMIKGQQLDMDYEKTDKLSEEDIINMYNRKTCALISAGCVCGAICAEASDKHIHLARSFGVALGLAFQIADDLLDLKTEKTGKKTYATLFGEKRAGEKSREYTDMVIKIADRLPKSEFLKELAISLNNRKV
jgi:geranylgeranyl diphosphate synthase type II